MSKFEENQKVQVVSNSKIGEVKLERNSVNGIIYQVEFSDGSLSWIDEDNLKEFIKIENPIKLFETMTFSGIESYKRVISYQRLAGGLTNLFFSMNNSLTEYLPHQFLPVIKFLKSPEDRLLIADEVGLGKTIEAMYIWKELEARKNAKRLLIVCPAALREKWKKDMINLFGINPEIVNAKELYEKFNQIKANRKKEQFACICSMESIRTKKDGGFTNIQKLNKAFEDFTDDFAGASAFDLTIIDEAHYLRNKETANFKTGARLRDISSAMILLSATPIQTSSDNLFSILNILAPETFSNIMEFEYLLNNDKPFIELANCMQRTNSTSDNFNEILEKFSDNLLIKNNDLIKKIQKECEEVFNSKEKKMVYSEQLRSFVFYDNYFTRTRRRFVFTDTAKRRPQAIRFILTHEQKHLYDRVSQLINAMAKGQAKILTFALISRQRQMASCLPAAFKDWKQKYLKMYGDDYFAEDLLSDDTRVQELNELLYSDFSEANEIENESEKTNKIPDLNPFFKYIVEEFRDVRYEDLKLHDTKFSSFLLSIKEQLKNNPKEKIIVFSFFRGTNEYLEERLREEKITCVAIKGGMIKEKDKLLDDFRTDPSINVLISTEVGAEGLDLQFASIEYNYDLPWNPMRLEQRIGRIDRIGQKAKVLQIFNLTCENTVEDRILERLYERVEIFRNSIGDLEDIIGEPIQELALELINAELTETEKEEKAEQKIQALIKQRQINERLEEESGLLDEYRNLVLKSINKAKDNNRFIGSNELIFIISDFLKKNYEGSSFFQLENKKNYYKISLSDEARQAFKEYKRLEHNDKLTSIVNSPEVVFAFNCRKDEKLSGLSEFVDSDHPIFDWIKYDITQKKQNITCCSAITIKPSDLISKGKYIYYIQKWKNFGIDKTIELKYFLCNMETNIMVNENIGEEVLNAALINGSSLINPGVRVDNISNYLTAGNTVYNYGWDKFNEYKEITNLKKNTLFEKQKKFVEDTFNKKISKQEERLQEQRIKLQNDQSRSKYHSIDRTKTNISKLNMELKDKIHDLEKELLINPELEDLSLGILFVEE